MAWMSDLCWHIPHKQPTCRCRGSWIDGPELVSERRRSSGRSTGGLVRGFSWAVQTHTLKDMVYTNHRPKFWSYASDKSGANPPEFLRILKVQHALQ